MAREALARLQTLRLPQVLAIVGSHLVLVGSVVWGELTYLMLHALFAIELVLINVFTAPFYRRWKRHAIDIARSTFGMSALLLLLFGGWAVMIDGRGDPLQLALAGVDASVFGWGVAYVVAHLAFTALQAWLSPEPRYAWLRAVAVDGAASMLAAVAMVFLTFFAGLVLAAAIDSDTLAIGLAIATIVVRLPIALLASTMTDTEHRSAADDPWAAMER